MTLALYVGIACAVIGALFWICALALFPVETKEEDQEPYGDASLLGRDEL